MKKLALTSALFLIFLTFGGCSSEATRFSGCRSCYSWGTLKSDLSYSLEHIYSASLAAVEQLDIDLVDRSSDAMTAAIMARDIQNDLVRITIRKYADDKASIKIIVGDLGNRRKSNLIFNRIAENLGCEPGG